MKAFPTFAVILVATSFPLVAKDYLVASENVRFTLPDDWTVLKKMDAFFAAGTTEQKEFVSISVHPASPSQKPPDYDSVHGANKNAVDFVKKNGDILTIDSERPSMLAGLSCFETRYHTQLPTGQIIYARDYVLLADAKFYSFSIESWKHNDEAMMDKIAGSFHFLADKDPESTPLSPK